MKEPPKLQSLEDWPEGVCDRDGRDLAPGDLVRVLGHDGMRSHDGHVVSCGRPDAGGDAILQIWQDGRELAPHLTTHIERQHDNSGRPLRWTGEENDMVKKSTKKAPKKSGGSSRKNGTKGTRAANDEFVAEEHPVMGGEQSVIPGVETPENAEIEKVAKEMHKAKRNYAAWGRTASVLNERLVSLMNGEGLQHYWRNGVEVALNASDPKVKADVTIER